jgi:hypothetical protein
MVKWSKPLSVAVTMTLIPAAVTVVRAETFTLELKRLGSSSFPAGVSPPAEFAFRSTYPQSFYMQSGMGSYVRPGGEGPDFSDVIQKEPAEYQTDRPFRGVAKLGSQHFGFVLDTAPEKQGPQTVEGGAAEKQEKGEEDEDKPRSQLVRYNRLLFDRNHNGDLTDDEVIEALVASDGLAGSWLPRQATGEPDTPVAGDYATAWASLTPDGQDEWLMVEYDEAALPARVEIHETYNPGAVCRVTVFTDDGREVEAWSGEDPTPVRSQRGVSKIPVQVDFKTKRVKIYLDSTNVKGWNEIDAVALVDASGQTQWAAKAEASSTFGSNTGVFVGQSSSWSPQQATGKPNTPESGDHPTAWASLTPDEQDEWLLVEYAEAVVPTRVDVHETYNPGAVRRLTVFADDGREVEVWSGKDPTAVGSERGISKLPIQVDFKTKRLKIYLDSTGVAGWNEIDAVGLVDASGQTQWAEKAEASSTYADLAANAASASYSFPRVDLTIETDGVEMEYAFLLSVHSYASESYQYASASLNAAAYREGEVTLDGKKRRIVLVDYNSNGRFDDVWDIDKSTRLARGGVYPRSGDVIFVDPDSIEGGGMYGYDMTMNNDQQLVSKLLAVDGRFYDLEIPPPGNSITVTRSSVPVGYITNPNQGYRALVWSDQGMLKVVGDESGRAPLPEGDWRLLSYTINSTGLNKATEEQGDEPPSPWPRYTLVSATATGDSGAATVRKGETVAFAFGPPYKPTVTAYQQPGSQTARLSMSLVGSAGEHCTNLMVSGSRPGEPEFTISGSDGEKVHTGKFEYG